LSIAAIHLQAGELRTALGGKGAASAHRFGYPFSAFARARRIPWRSRISTIRRMPADRGGNCLQHTRLAIFILLKLQLL
jgi:hypothetical protein